MSKLKLKSLLIDTQDVRDVLNRNKTDVEITVKHNKQPFNQGDFLYVRESICERNGKCEYKADYDVAPSFAWKSSCIMPKSAARLFLKVLNVKKLEEFAWKISFELCTREDVEYGIA